MSNSKASIPVNSFGDELDDGLTIERISLEDLPPIGDWEQPERHDGHSFFLVERGSVSLEIDFQKYDVRSPTLIYMHPDQVHRILDFNKVTAFVWAMRTERINAVFLSLLEEIAPTIPMVLSDEQFNLISDAVSLIMKFRQRRDVPLYYPIVNEQVSSLVGLAISFFLEKSTANDQPSRQEQITRAFRRQLGLDFLHKKRPAAYAEALHLSIPYLNECVKSTTGQPVSVHIQQRVMLEAKRLLYHSDQSLKEIAATLGYDDYPYFSRLFSKTYGTSPAAFRKQKLD